MNIEYYRDQALAAYERVPQSEAAAWLQAVMAAEQAIQLQGINDKLQEITELGGYLDASTGCLTGIEAALQVMSK